MTRSLAASANSSRQTEKVIKTDSTYIIIHNYAYIYLHGGPPYSLTWLDSRVAHTCGDADGCLWTLCVCVCVCGGGGGGERERERSDSILFSKIYVLLMPVHSNDCIWRVCRKHLLMNVCVFHNTLHVFVPLHPTQGTVAISSVHMFVHRSIQTVCWGNSSKIHSVLLTCQLLMFFFLLVIVTLSRQAQLLCFCYPHIHSLSLTYLSLGTMFLSRLKISIFCVHFYNVHVYTNCTFIWWLCLEYARVCV